MLCYFGVSTIRWTLTWTTGSLTYTCDLFACVYTHRTSHSKDFCRVCTQFDSGETLRQAQSLTYDSHLAVWWPHSVWFNLAFVSSFCSLCAANSLSMIAVIAITIPWFHCHWFSDCSAIALNWSGWCVYIYIYIYTYIYIYALTVFQTESQKKLLKNICIKKSRLTYL